MTYTPSLVLHILGGVIGVISGFAALFLRKGSRPHRIAGDVFVISMMIMGAAGVYAAAVKGQELNVLAGTYTFYLVVTAWLTASRTVSPVGRLSAAATAVGALNVAVALAFAAATRDDRAGCVVFGAITALSLAGDVRMFARGGFATSAQRMLRHIWRMGFALFIASGSFFLGMAGDPVMRRVGPRARLFTPEIRATHLPAVPVVLVIAMTIYWLARTLLSRRRLQDVRS